MAGGELTKTFRELEEAVDLLLKRTKGERRVSGERGLPGAAGIAVNPPTGEMNEEAVQLIRRALQRLKSL
ncbi:MAG: hypothetical protein GXP52_07400 [Deltaproteobacteria bacterium]|nr:hypothetical protein [Deltaproteobacteria bacterium]